MSFKTELWNSWHYKIRIQNTQDIFPQGRHFSCQRIKEVNLNETEKQDFSSFIEQAWPDDTCHAENPKYNIEVWSWKEASKQPSKQNKSSARVSI